MKIFWFFPTSGDGRHLATTVGARKVDFGYLKQIALAVDDLGYYGALIPTGRSYEDTWIVASALAGFTRRMRFIVAVRPGLAAPTLAIRMAASLDRISAGRLNINVVTSGDPVENAGEGIFLAHDERYEEADEFLEIWRGLATGKELNFSGKHFELRGAKLLLPFMQQPSPPLYLGGSSPAGLRLAAKHIDTYLTWGEPVAQVAEKVAAVRALAAAAGRTVRFGIRLHVIVRETEAAAWAAADDLIRYVDEKTIAAAQKIHERTESVGQKRMSELVGANRQSLVVGPNLWAGIGLTRAGCGTALVGNPENVAARIREYQAAGIDEFIFSGYPHLEEAYRVAELLFPLLQPEAPEILPAPENILATGEIIACSHFALASENSNEVKSIRAGRTQTA